MTILQSLAGYYDRMAARGEAEPPGFSREKIGFAVVIDREGTPVDVLDLRDTSGKRPVSSPRDVPASFKRPGVGVSPFFLWDTTAYALGVDSTADKRTPLKQKAFRDLHISALAGVDDEGLLAFRRFLENWLSDRFAEAPFRPEMLDANVVFALDGDHGDDGRPRLLHERPAALPLIEARVGEGASAFCLIAGTQGPVARLHPSIKGVDGAQTMGAALVSFNLDSFGSWGQAQGANAPTGQAAAARYGAALNRLLDRGSGNRLQLVADAHLDPSRRRSTEVRHRHRFRIGDTTTVFWADASDIPEKVAAAAEALAAMFMGEAERIAPAGDATLDEDGAIAAIVRDRLDSLADGRPAKIGLAEVPAGACIHILGLAPNAARLSVRFWLTQSLGELAANALLHHEHCRIEPLPRFWGTGPSINRLLVQTVAAQDKWDNIPPLLAGEVARAVLGGTAYPRTWLSNVMMRLRAGDDPSTGWHAAAIRAVLVRDQFHKRKDRNVPEAGETPVSLVREHPNTGYQLGRLFALLELAQREALGRGVNATIRDKYFGAASATPASIFPLIISNGQNHLSRLRKDRPGWAAVIERELEEVYGRITPVLPLTLPRSLGLEHQGEFAIGYYHQRAAKLGKQGPDAAPDDATDTDERE